MRSRMISAVLCLGLSVTWIEHGIAQSVEETTAQLQNEQAAQRAAAAQRLGEQGPAAKSALATLTKLLEDRDEIVRVRAAEAIWRIDGKLDAALPVLFAARRSEQAAVRKLTREVTEEIGPNARAALTLVVEQARLNRNQPQQQANDKVTQALSKLGLEALPAIVEQFDIDLEAPRARPDGQPDYNNFGNNQRFEGLIVPAIARQGATVIPTLKVLLTDPNSVVRGLAAEALGATGTPANEVLPLLLPMLDDRDGQTRLKVLTALLKLGPQNPVVREACGRVLREHKDTNLRTQTIIQLRTLGMLDQNPELLQAVRVALNDPEGNIRLSAAELLLSQSPPVADAAQTILAEANRVSPICVSEQSHNSRVFPETSKLRRSSKSKSRCETRTSKSACRPSRRRRLCCRKNNTCRCCANWHRTTSSKSAFKRQICCGISASNWRHSAST